MVALEYEATTISASSENWTNWEYLIGKLSPKRLGVGVDASTPFLYLHDVV